MSDVLAKSIEKDETTEADEAEEFDTLDSEMKAIDADLVRLKRLEQIQKSQAKPVEASGTKAATESRDYAVVKNTKKAEPGIVFARYA